MNEQTEQVNQENVPEGTPSEGNGNILVPDPEREEKIMKIRRRRKRRRKLTLLGLEAFIALILVGVLLFVIHLINGRLEKQADIDRSNSSIDEYNRQQESLMAESRKNSDTPGQKSSGESSLHTETDPESGKKKPEEEKEGFRVVYRQKGKEEITLFDSEEEYARVAEARAGDTLELELYNYGDEETTFLIMMDCIGKDAETAEDAQEPELPFTAEMAVKAGESAEFLFVPETERFSCSVIVKGEPREAYVCSAGGMDFVREAVSAETGRSRIHICGNEYAEYYVDALGAFPFETDVIWKRNAPPAEEFARLTNVETLNGEQLRELSPYGGKCGATLLSATIPQNANPVLQQNISFTLRGNSLDAYVPYYVPEAFMRNMTVVFSVEGGTVRCEGEGANADGTLNLTGACDCIVTDEAGATRRYRLTGHRLAHNLPVVYLTTENGQGITSKDNYISGTFAMDANGVEGFTDVATRGIRLRGKGHLTWNRKDWPKKSIKLSFDEKLALMGDNKDSDWALSGNYYDRSLTRNYLGLELARTLDHLEFTPDLYPVDVFFNGEYFGLYDLSETVEVAGGRVDIARDPSATDSGFLVEVGGNKNYIYPGMLKDVEIHYPKEPTGDQRAFINGYLTELNNRIVTGQPFDDLVDMDSFVDWVILEEFMYNWDAHFVRNVFMYKEPGGKLKFGPVWDFDMALGNAGCPDWHYNYYALSMNGPVGLTWMTYLYQSPDFLARLKNRWSAVGERLYNTANATLDEMLPVMDPSFEENYWRWMQPMEGQNLAWEWEMEYTQRHLSGLYGYLKSVLTLRQDFLNSAWIEGNPVPQLDNSAVPPETEPVVESEGGEDVVPEGGEDIGPEGDGGPDDGPEEAPEIDPAGPVPEN